MRIFKIVVFSLLALDVVLMWMHETVHDAIEQFGWVILLTTFLYESSQLKKDYASPVEKYGLMTLILTGYALALFAAQAYFANRRWLDFANSATWLAVCALIAYDVYAPGDYGGLEWRIRNAVKIALYSALIVYVGIWIWKGIESQAGLVGFLHAYDAALWIASFAVIELNVFQFEKEENPALEAASTGV